MPTNHTPEFCGTDTFVDLAFNMSQRQPQLSDLKVATAIAISAIEEAHALKEKVALLELALHTARSQPAQQAKPTVQRCTSCGGAKVPQTLLATGACDCEQAEPGADEREEAGSLIGDGFVLEFERWNDVTGALPRNGSWLAEVSDIIQRAAQSGQRAGVAEGWDSSVYGYQDYFNAISAATRICGDAIAVSVSDFHAAMRRATPIDAALTQQQEGGT